ncbi:hypothetical protein LDE02_17080 [Lactobacillus delbrueckii subsp. lactis]|nr:hypothetical protein LDE02_17080 [Lactobacillus delbrueckii subsp. lactis]
MLALLVQFATGHGYRRRCEYEEYHIDSFTLDYNIKKDSIIEQLQFNAVS